MDYTTLVQDALGGGLWTSIAVFLHSYAVGLILVGGLVAAIGWVWVVRAVPHYGGSDAPLWVRVGTVSFSGLYVLTCLVVTMLHSGNLTSYPATLDLAQWLDDCGSDRVVVTSGEMVPDQPLIELRCDGDTRELLGQQVQEVDRRTASVRIVEHLDELARERRAPVALLGD